MYWEEKIEYLKKEFTQAEFSFPFHDWVNIMKKMEDRFLTKITQEYHFSNWSDQIKHKALITSINRTHIQTTLGALSDDTNYWVVIVVGRDALGKHCLYNCNVASMRRVVSLQRNPFFIVDKKYNWFVYFDVNESAHVNIFKSGHAITPFDHLVA